MIFLRANNVLCDCEVALEMLEHERFEDKWRVHWVGAVALIRAVGHVLRHVDREEFPEFAHGIDAAFESWKKGDEHLIFREFIDQERNNVLKEYRSSIHELGVVRLVGEAAGKLPIMLEQTDDGNFQEWFELDENMYRPRLSGYLAGEDARDIYRNAIAWWRAELTGIVKG